MLKLIKYIERKGEIEGGRGVEAKMAIDGGKPHWCFRNRKKRGEKLLTAL